MINYYQYQGTISTSEGNGQELILHDINNGTQPPIRISVICKGLAKYLNDRGWTDAEERYITQTWIYDWNLCLQAVVIPSSDETRPAKVIACADPDKITEHIVIFGPQELIDTPKPEPMEKEDFFAWWHFRGEHNLRPVN